MDTPKCPDYQGVLILGHYWLCPYYTYYTDQTIVTMLWTSDYITRKLSILLLS